MAKVMAADMVRSHKEKDALITYINLRKISAWSRRLHALISYN